jgi:hypothetical protein
MAKFQVPIEMHHPAYDAGKPAKLAVMNDGSGFTPGTVIQNGTPCRYQPMSAASDEDEESLRAKGYMRKGEGQKPVEGYHAFPKMLVHPDHVPAVPDEIMAQKEDGKGIKTYVVKGTKEKLGPVIVNDAAEESAWQEKGYAEPVRSDPQAFERLHAVPYDPDARVNGYPRWENGTLVNDPGIDTSGRQQYPKWVSGVLVESAAQEVALLDGTSEFPDARIEALLSERRAASEREDEKTVTRIETLLADHGIEVKDKPHGTVWRRVEAKVIDEVGLTGVELEIATEAELKDMGGGMDPKADLIAEAEARGIKIDKRWNLAKLQEALAAAA